MVRERTAAGPFPVQADAAGWSEHDILAQAEAIGHLGAWAWEISTDTLWWSDEVYRIFGVQPQEFPATFDAFMHHVHPEDHGHLQTRIRAALAADEPYLVDHRVVRPDGEIRFVREQGTVGRDEDGSPVRMLGIVHDITEEHLLRVALAQSEERYRLLAENAYDVIWSMDPDGTITYVSPAVERVRGLTAEEASVQPLDEIHPADSLAKVLGYFSDLHKAIAQGTEPPTFQDTVEYYRKDGSIMVGELQVTPQVDADGRVVAILGVTRDISERALYEKRLKQLAVTDPLTGVWNRREGQRLLSADLAAAHRYGQPLCLLALDLDHFKNVNDTYGHQAGDEVLVEICHRLREHTRPSDILIRWGGEEFVVIARNTTLDAATVLADKILTLVSGAPIGQAGTVTASLGVASVQPDDTLDALLHRADDALYAAKAAGRNTTRVAV